MKKKILQKAARETKGILKSIDYFLGKLKEDEPSNPFVSSIHRELGEICEEDLSEKEQLIALQDSVNDLYIRNDKDPIIARIKGFIDSQIEKMITS